MKLVSDLSVQLNSELAVKAHVSNKVASSCCFYQLHRLQQITLLVGQEVTAQLIFAFVLSHLDYCNSMLVGLPRSVIKSFLRILNVAAKLVLNLRLSDYITASTPATPVVAEYKQSLIMHLVRTNWASLSRCHHGV